jgi:hypothetical protein
VEAPNLTPADAMERSQILQHSVEAIVTLNKSNNESILSISSQNACQLHVFLTEEAFDTIETETNYKYYGTITELCCELNSGRETNLRNFLAAEIPPPKSAVVLWCLFNFPLTV